MLRKIEENISSKFLRCKVVLLEEIAIKADTCYKINNQNKCTGYAFSNGTKNNYFEEPFWNIEMMLGLNKTSRLKTTEKCFHLKGCGAMNNPNKTSKA